MVHSFWNILLCGVALLVSSDPSASQTLLFDAETRPVPTIHASAPRDFASLGNPLLFSADERGSGREPWLTDGTTTGTLRALDLRAGFRGSDPRNFTTLPNGMVIFQADDGQHGHEPWITDGTPLGWRLLRDVHPGPESSGVWPFTLSGVRAFFHADDGTHGVEPWVTDGTAAGTHLVHDLLPGPGSSTNGRHEMAPIANGRVIFSTRRANWELWVTDGSSSGTQLLTTFPNATLNYAPEELTSIGDRVVFRMWSSGSGEELWVTDGTPAGTIELLDLLPGSNGSRPVELTSDGTRAYFLALTSAGQALHVTDGTVGGTRAIHPATSNPLERTRIVGFLPSQELLFAIYDSTTGTLWRTRGSAASTVLVTNTAPEPNRGDFAILGSRTIFSARDSRGFEVWSTDGTFSGTYLVADLRAGAESSHPNTFHRVGNAVVFAAEDSLGNREPWVTDGTTTGTTLLREIGREHANQGSNPRLLGTFREEAYYAVTTPQGLELYATNGHVPGTRRVGGLQSFTLDGIQKIAALDHAFLFRAVTPNTGSELWVSDGTPAGTRLLRDIDPLGSSRPESFVRLGDRIFFSASDGAHGRELWSSDGTLAGTRMIVDLEPGPLGSQPNDFAVWNDRLLFRAFTAAHGHEPRITDGTALGTQLLVDAAQGREASTGLFADGHAHGSFYYFQQRTSAHGAELWQTDGTSAGTRLFADLAPGSTSSFPTAFTRLGEKLIFHAHGTELLRFDASPSTRLFRLLQLPPGEIIHTSPIRVDDDHAVFLTRDRDRRIHLWRTDGERAGTTFVRTIDPHGAHPSQQVSGTHLGASRALLTLDDGVDGEELWTSDGSAAGTNQVLDLGLEHASPAQWARVGNRLVFTADDGVHGRELHAIDFHRTEDYVAESYGHGCGSSVPELFVNGPARVTVTTSTIEMRGAFPNRPSFLLLGARRGFLPLGSGCHLWVDAPFLWPVLPNARGDATLPLLTHPTWLGWPFDLQFVTSDAANALHSSQGLEILFGS